MVTTGNLNLSPEALAALAQKANRSDNELARSLGISMDEIVDAQLPDTDANNKQIFESNPFFDPTKFGQALAANARVDAGGYITEEEINKSENGKDEENDLLDIIQNNLAREEAERARLQAEWDEAEHDICGVSMSGENWRNLSNSLRDNEKSRNWLLNRFMQQGMTPQEAEAEAKLYELVYSGMSKPEQYRTDEENAAIREIPNHPNFRNNTNDFLDFTRQTSELSNEQTASASLHAGNQSIKSGDDLISSMSGVSNAGNFTPNDTLTGVTAKNLITRYGAVITPETRAADAAFYKERENEIRSNPMARNVPAAMLDAYIKGGQVYIEGFEKPINPRDALQSDKVELDNISELNQSGGINTNVQLSADFKAAAMLEPTVVPPANQIAPVIQQPNQVASVQSYEMSVGI